MYVYIIKCKKEINNFFLCYKILQICFEVKVSSSWPTNYDLAFDNFLNNNHVNIFQLTQLSYLECVSYYKCSLGCWLNGEICLGVVWRLYLLTVLLALFLAFRVFISNGNEDWTSLHSHGETFRGPLRSTGTNRLQHIVMNSNEQFDPEKTWGLAKWGLTMLY